MRSEKERLFGEASGPVARRIRETVGGISPGLPSFRRAVCRAVTRRDGLRAGLVSWCGTSSPLAPLCRVPYTTWERCEASPRRSTRRLSAILRQPRRCRAARPDSPVPAPGRGASFMRQGLRPARQWNKQPNCSSRSLPRRSEALPR
jgi:hypothetical protein